MKKSARIAALFAAALLAFPTGTSAAGAQNSVMYDENKTPISGTYKEPSRQGYKFLGWSTTKEKADDEDADFDVNNVTGGGTRTVYAAWQQGNAKYAVALYGIDQDKDRMEGGNYIHTMTFGPATGGDYTTSHKDAHIALSAETDSDRCIHNHSWDEIIALCRTNPHVFDKCVKAGCTNTVNLDINDTLKGGGWTDDCRSKETGDGPSILYDELRDEFRVWQPGTGSGDFEYGDNTGGYPASRIRAVLNGYDWTSNGRHGNTTNNTRASIDNITSNNCLLSCFPENLRTAIIPKAVKSDTVYNHISGNNVTTWDNLWLFSGKEMYIDSDIDSGTSNRVIRPDEGEIYDRIREQNITTSAYAGNKNYRLYGVSGDTHWWLRSAYRLDQISACDVNNFGDWSFNSTGYSGDAVAPGFVICGDKTAYELPRYTISFNGNGGSGTMASVAATTGKPYTLPANTFTNAGYKFAGWNTKADGSGTSYSDRANVTDVGPAGTTVTLYAQWKFITQTITDSRTLTIQTPGWYTITAYGAKGGDAAGRKGSESEVARASGGAGGVVSMRVYLAKGNMVYTENGQYGGSALTSNDEPGGNGGARAAVAINGSTVMIAGGGGGAVSGGGIGYYGTNALPAVNGGAGGILCNVSNDSDHTGYANGQGETAFTSYGWHNVGGGGGGYYGGRAGGRYREENYGSYLTEYEGFPYVTPGHNGNGHLTILGYEGYARYRDGLASSFDQGYGTYELHQQGNYNLPRIGTGRWYYLFTNVNVDNIPWKYRTGRGAGDGDSSYSGAPQAVLNVNPVAGYTRRNDLGIWVYHNDVTWPIDYVPSDKRYEFADDAYAPFNYYASTINMTRKSYPSFGGTSWYNSGYWINGQAATFSARGGVNTNQHSYVVIAADNGVSSARAAVRRSAAKMPRKSTVETKTPSMLKEQYVDSSGKIILRQNKTYDYTPWIVEKDMKVSELLPEDIYVEEMRKTIHVSHGIPDISGYVFDHMEIDGKKVLSVSPGTYTDENGTAHSYQDGAIARCVYKKK